MRAAKLRHTPPPILRFMPEYDDHGNNITRTDRTLHGGEVRPSDEENHAEFTRLETVNQLLTGEFDAVAGFLTARGAEFPLPPCLVYANSETRGEILYETGGRLFNLVLTDVTGNYPPRN
jgi:hypothetical protein